MEDLAEAEGGTAALVDVLSENVTGPYDVMRIAKRLVEEGRDDEALAWLTRGLAEYPPDRGLRALAAECHLRAGRRSEAAELLWANFVDLPELGNYVALSNAAGDFPPWRRKALAHLREEPRRDVRFSAAFDGSRGHTRLVQVLLWENDVEGAWNAALAGGCSDESWVKLARRRSATHPEDALPILLEAADHAIAGKDRGWYARAAGFLREARPLFRRKADFEAHLAGLRQEHRPKRALQDELDRAGLP